MDLLTRLATATEAAAAAAQAAVQVSQATASSPTGAQAHQDDRQWHKLVNRPSVFEPKSREEETGMWKDWFWSVEQFLATVDVAFQAELTEVTNHLDREQSLSGMTQVQKERSHFLYSLMASLLRGRPLQILKAVPNSNGYEAVRQLVGSIQPASRNRSLAMLSSLMSWPQFDLRQSILAQLLKLEEAEREYSRIATELSDEIKFAVLMKSVPPGQLRTYLTVQISDTSSYNDLRSALLRYDTATTKWNSATALGFDNSSQQHGEVAPMDVDRVFNKGDGKGKGKGKDQKGGKGGKSKDKQNKGSWDWQQNKGKTNKGKGAGGGKDGKGKQQFQSGKGYSHRPQGACFNCGKPGHVAKNCWATPNQQAQRHTYGQSYSGVRSVEFDETPYEPRGNAASVTPSTTPSSAQAMQQAQQASQSAQQQRVRRVFADVSFEQVGEQDQAIVFDLTAGDHANFEPFGSVGMVRFSAVSTEFFRLDACDDTFDEPPHNMPVYSLLDEQVEQHEQQHDSHTTRAACAFADGLSSCDVHFSADGIIRMVSSDQAGAVDVVDIIIDSGSDASMLPLQYMHVGSALTGQVPILCDAQGGRIPVSSCKKVVFELETDGSPKAILKERVHVGAVQSPLISFGRLLACGWEIVHSEGGPVLRHNSGSRVPIHMKGHSLAVRGYVRHIGEQQLTVVVDPALLQLSFGWNLSPSGGPLLRCIATHFTDPTEMCNVEEWPCRTTLIKSSDGAWSLIEFCERILNMEDRAGPLGTNEPVECLVILSERTATPEQMGFSVCEVQSLPVGSAHDDSGQQDVPLAPQDAQDTEEHVEGGAQDAPVVHVRVEPDQQTIEVEGVQLSLASGIGALRAACKVCSLSQSGSKAKLFKRLCDFHERQRISMSQEVAMKALQDSERIPAMVPKPEVPDEAAVARHRLTHQPYAAWCETCVKVRARSDKHVRDEGAPAEREIPTVSMDFCYTSYSEDDESKLCCLVLHHSATKAVQAIPLSSKSAMKYMTLEVVRFTVFTGVGELILRCDQEPVLLSLQRNVQQARQRMGLHTVIENAPIGSHASNANVENSVHRLRGMATTLLVALEEKTSLVHGVKHAITAWAWVHAGWILNRFGTRGNTTAYELIHGHAYTGRLVEFAEPLLSYVVVEKNPHKGAAKWVRSIFLTKSNTNDMFLVAVAGKIRLTRSVRRTGHAWTDYMEHYQKLETPPWEMEGIIGARILPTSKPMAQALEVFPALGAIQGEAAEEPSRVQIQTTKVAACRVYRFLD